VTDWDRTLVSIAIDAAKNCIHVFEEEYPADDRPRKALEATEKWLKEPTQQNLQLLGKLETQIWRSEGWHGPAGSAAQACGCAARSARHPLSSAMDAIGCERYANGIKPGEYTRKWLYLVLRQNVRPAERAAHITSKISSSSSG
jgi:hypothetical protein